MGRQIVVGTSGHFIHLDEPETVIRAIREIVDAVRNAGHERSATGA